MAVCCTAAKPQECKPEFSSLQWDEKGSQPDTVRNGILLPAYAGRRSG